MTTMTLHIPIEDLRVGESFRLREDPESSTRIVRTIDPITYVNRGNEGMTPQAVTNLTMNGVHRVWVDREAEQPAAIRTADEAQSDSDLYLQGVHDGYAKARAEVEALKATRAEGMVRTSTRKRAVFRREDAIVLAIQAHTAEGPGVIELAQAIEQYVNGDTIAEAHAAGFREGVDSVTADVVAAHPAAGTEFPSTIETADDAALDWPEGTKVRDKDGDPWRRGDDRLYIEGSRDGWLYKGYESGTVRLDSYLPATVTRLGGAS